MSYRNGYNERGVDIRKRWKDDDDDDNMVAVERSIDDFGEEDLDNLEWAFQKANQMTP